MSVNRSRYSMATLLETGGQVVLWAGWSLQLPPSYHQVNDDGSWSAWGADWALDIHILEVAEHALPEQLLGSEYPATLSGPGWLGCSRVLVESDAGATVYRLAGTLAATGTLMSCWVSCQNEERLAFAKCLIQGVSNAKPRAA
jgi:hypothetical protein